MILEPAYYIENGIQTYNASLRKLSYARDQTAMHEGAENRKLPLREIACLTRVHAIVKISIHKDKQ
jgi:hypothetical protein